MSKIPYAVFNSKALLNPYQYLPFNKIIEFNDVEGKYEWNGKNLLITDEVGVGKTFEVGIILQEMLKNDNNLKVAIICPVKLCENWCDELSDNFGFDVNNYRKSKIATSQINIIPYSYFSKNFNVNYNSDDEAKIEIEMIEGSYDENDIKEVFNYDILILDEAHYIKNKKGKLWNSINKVIATNENESKCKLKIFMSGTPIYNSIDDYNNITELLEIYRQKFETTKTLQSEANCYDSILKISLWGNKEKAEAENGWGRNKIIFLSDEEKDIIAKIKSFDCGNLKQYFNRLSSSSLQVLKESLKEKVVDPDYILVSVNGEKYVDIEGELQDYYTKLGTGDTKLDGLNELLEQLKKENENKQFKCIIFTCFRLTCEYLKGKLTKYKVLTITGETKVAEVESIKNEFKNYNEPIILICTDAAKEGHNLQFCHYLIHYDLPYTPAALGQRNGRIYRRGQKQQPEVFYLLTTPGYDARLFGEIILSKSRVINYMSENNNISALNVMPWDADWMVKKAVEEYFDEFNSKKINIDDEIVSKLKSLLKSNFYKNDNWELDEIKDIYKNLSIESFDDSVNKVKKIYTDKLNTNNNENESIKLSKIYQKEYNSKFNALVKEWTGTDCNCDINEIKKVLESSLKDKCNTIKSKFSCDMINNDEMTIEEYKKQFIPLYEII